jgi:hypothetical protein
MRAIAMSSAVLHRPLRRNEHEGSVKMQTMQEALAREHMRQLESEAHRFRLDSEPGRRRYLRTSQRRGRQAHRMLRGAARSGQHSASAK